MRRFSVGTVLAALFAATVIPIAVFVMFLMAQLQANEKVSLQRRTQSYAIAISRAVDPVLNEMTAILNLVTSIEDFDRQNLASLHHRLKKELAKSGNYFVVLGADGRHLLNTRTDFSPYNTVHANLANVQAVMAGEGRNVSGLQQEPIEDAWTFNVYASIESSAGTGIETVQISRNAGDLRQIFESLALPPEWQAVIVDGTGMIVSAKDAIENPTGSQLELPGSIETETLEWVNGLRTADDREGTRHLIGYADIRGTDWKGFVYGPVASAQRSILTTWQQLLVGSLIFFTLAAIALYVFSRNINKSIRGVAGMARAMGAGEIVSPVNSRIEEINFIATTLSEASFDRSQKEDTIQLAMQELSHRTKNLIAVIISVVRQTAKSASSLETMKGTLTERIMGLGHSIDLLTLKDWRAVPLSDLIKKQLSNFGTIGENVFLEGPEVQLKPEAVQHLGMALHELATNALKYGALSTSKGTVKITWKIREENGVEKLILNWRENDGPGPCKPGHTGFGTQILDRHMASAFAGKTELCFEDCGFTWRLKGVLSRFTGSEKDPVLAKRKF